MRFLKGASALPVVLLSLLAPAAKAELIYGLTNLQELVTFDSNTRAVTSTVGLTGFGIGGELLTSIDIRPATGQLYGLSSLNNIYVINPATGSRTQVGGTITPAPTGSLRAIDFNPTVDRIRLVTTAGNNLRLNPDTGAIQNTDGALAFAAGDTNFADTPGIVNAAYTNSFPGAASTTLFDLDATNDVLATQAPPNDGTLNTRGPLGFNLGTTSSFTGFDISGVTGNAYVVGNNLLGGGFATNSLYTVNLVSGAATLAGPVTGVNGSFRDLAVVVAPEPTTLTALLGAIGLLAARKRSSNQ